MKIAIYLLIDVDLRDSNYSYYTYRALKQLIQAASDVHNLIIYLDLGIEYQLFIHLALILDKPNFVRHISSLNPVQFQ